MQKMKVNEIFYSVQGEIQIGKPVVFIRLSGCNLINENKGCDWCDTKYAQKGEEMSINEIIDEISKYNCDNVVITGGEPMLQKEELLFLLQRLNENGYDVFIETNGTIYDDDIFDLVVDVNCSPKKQAIDLEVLENLNLYNNVNFKFVYDDDLWWEEIIKKLNIERQDVWIMPQGKSKKEQEEQMKKVVDYCKDKGYNFTPRIHVLIYNERRGV